jgi:hypothetical protein
VFRPLVARFGLRIDFARRTFCWDSDTDDKAVLHRG